MRVDGDSIHQHRQRRAIRMADDLLVVMDSLSVLDDAQGCQLLRGEYTPIHAENTDTVLFEKIGHRLPMWPVCSPDGCSCTVREDQACIIAAYKIDAAGQFIEDHLQQCPPGLCLGMDPAFK